MTATPAPRALDDIPSCFAYFRNEPGPAGRAAAEKLGRFVTGSIKLPADTVRAMGGDRCRGDVLSDTFIEAAFADGYAGKVRKMVDQALAHGVGSVEDAPAELRALFHHLDTEPDWLDWNLVERGARVFRQYGSDAFLYFGVVTIGGYRREEIQKPLVLTGAYTGGSAFGRFLETCRFWTDVSEPDALRQGGAGRKTAVMVRIMHSMIRHTIAPHQEWDEKRFGVPLNQYDQFTTIMLSFLLSQHMKRLGYRITEEETLAHMHFWRYVGYLMGVEPAFYPETTEDWWRASYVLTLSSDPHDGADSRRLSQSFIDAFQPAPEDQGEQRAAKEREYRKVLGYAGFFVPAATLAVTGVPQAGLLRWQPLTRFVPHLVTSTARRVVPGFAAALDLRRRQSRTAWLSHHTGGRPAAFAPVERLSR
ncbi:oxygenase MpaB family protein [Streptomyces rubradiris]|uniref:oxygenase MpaB family protein n=1 Tax=Streptomyces rubradiris TaxID=285531 RepID=UPI0033FF2032